MKDHPSPAPVISKAWATRFDRGRHHRGKLGFVILATDHAVEDDLRAIIPADIGVHVARTAYDGVVTPEGLRAIAPEIARAAGTILPEIGLAVIAYACTSGSMILGEAEVERLLRAGKPQVTHATSLIAAATRALHAVGAKKIAVATPYLDSVNTPERDHLVAAGFDVLAFEGLNIAHDNDIARVAPEFIAEFAAAVDVPEADALFISCSGLRAIHVIEDLEASLGKPVVTSNQALAWHTLRLAGINDAIPGYGRVLRAH